MSNPLRGRVADTIRAEMRRQGKTGAQLATDLRISRAAASRRINGVVDISLDDLDEIADWLGVPLMELIAPVESVVA